MPLAIKINTHTFNRVIRCPNCEMLLEEFKMMDGLIVCSTCRYMFPNTNILSRLDLPTAIIGRKDITKNHGAIYMGRRERELTMLKFHIEEPDFWLSQEDY